MHNITNRLTRLETAVSQLSRPATADLARYRYRPGDYIREQLGWIPWGGTAAQPGQVEVIDAYALALRQLHERAAWEQGELAADELRFWRPGQVIKNYLRIEAGHTVGKTKLLSGLFSHFFDCVPDHSNRDGCVIYTFAPTYEQINDLLWKEIRSDRERNPALPGQVLKKPELAYRPNHFARGKATSNARGAGTERAQGQHERYLMFILDEAEGIDDFVWDAVDSMASGGIVMVLMAANPRTHLSQFHRRRERPQVANFRISCHHHPNILQGREVVPGAVRRDYVESMLDAHCTAVSAHDPDRHTFELPWRPGEIWRPDNEYLFRVLGIAPRHDADNVFVSIGRYEAAAARPDDHQLDPTAAYIGVDVARQGSDYGTVYVRQAGRIWRQAQLRHATTPPYYDVVRQAVLALRGSGATRIHIRIDGTGGFGGGLVDLLGMDEELRRNLDEWRVVEVPFGAAAHNKDAYADIVTEMYAEAAETLLGCRLVNPPPELEADLTARRWGWVNRRGRDVKKLEEKEGFRGRIGRSPDDGDGLVLAAAPPHIFQRLSAAPVVTAVQVYSLEHLFG